MYYAITHAIESDGGPINNTPLQQKLAQRAKLPEDWGFFPQANAFRGNHFSSHQSS